ncbi:hypothetical protein DL767_011289 [Monosporascus sp. MG133]|nr:hypothetical protein DL767_011289 [Monosporascus sp. MG133]
MAPSQITDDYYAVLGVTSTVDVETLKSAWKRLAKLKHPDKNPRNPNATAEFQLLQAAYSTLSDPIERRRYDLQYTPQPRTDATSPNNHGQGSATKPTERQSARKSENEERLKYLERKRAAEEATLLEAKRRLERVQEGVRKLEEEALKETREQNAKNTWSGYFYSFVAGKHRETDDEKAERERRRLDRLAAQRIKERDMERQKLAVQGLEASLRATESDIGRIKRDIDREKAEEEEARRKEEWRRWHEEMLRRRAEQERCQREEERRAEEERARKRAEQERYMREQERRAEEERARKRAEQERSQRQQERRAEEERARKRAEQEIYIREQARKAEEERARRAAEVLEKQRQEREAKEKRQAETPDDILRRGRRGGPSEAWSHYRL